MITVIIPTYNESKRIPNTLRQIEMFRAENPHLITEVLIVDDGSKDNTIEEAMRFRAKIPMRYHVCPVNVGKWNAISIGIRKSFGWILLLDADGAASIWELRKCPLTRKTASFGTRFGRGAKVDREYMFRNIVSYMFAKYYRLCYMLISKKRYNINDFQCPFKLFHTANLDGSIESRRFGGDLELAMHLNVKTIHNIPVDFQGNMKQSIRMLIEFPKIAWRTRKS